MDIIISLIGGLGVGSLLTLFIKEYIDHRKTLSKRIFEEKRNAYVNYLDIIARSQTMPEQEALWARTSAISRIELCGGSEVVRLLRLVSEISPNSSSRPPINELVQAMRNDLFV